MTSHGKSIEDAGKVARSSEKKGKDEQAVAASQEKTTLLSERQRFTARKGTGGATRDKKNLEVLRGGELEAFAQDAELMGGEKLEFRISAKCPKISEEFSESSFERVQEAEEKERTKIENKNKEIDLEEKILGHKQKNLESLIEETKLNQKSVDAKNERNRCF